MVTSESLGGVIVGTLARNVRAVGSIPALGTLFPISFAAPSPTILLSLTLGIVKIEYRLVRSALE